MKLLILLHIPHLIACKIFYPVHKSVQTSLINALHQLLGSLNPDFLLVKIIFAQLKVSNSMENGIPKANVSSHVVFTSSQRVHLSVTRK